MSVEEVSRLYAEVKTWIAQKEVYQAATGQPAPLTNAQRKALEVLRVPSTPGPPPELGDVDYISLLFRYRQAHPAGGSIYWSEKEASSRTAGGAPGRICHVTIGEAYNHDREPVQSFPAVGYGLEGGESLPVFSRKKDAKRYAAKCAIDWLIDHSLMPDNMTDVTFRNGYQPQTFHPARDSSPSPSSSPSLSPSRSPSRSPPLRRPPTGAPNGNIGGGGAPLTAPAPTPPAKRQTRSAAAATTTGPADFNDESLPATQRVALLCPKLGWQPPNYVMSPSETGPAGYFDGYPDFEHDGGVKPLGLGQVTRVSGKEAARQQVAAGVLEYLLREFRKRQNLFKGLSAS